VGPSRKRILCIGLYQVRTQKKPSGTPFSVCHAHVKMSLFKVHYAKRYYLILSIIIKLVRPVLDLRSQWPNGVPPPIYPMNALRKPPCASRQCRPSPTSNQYCRSNFSPLKNEYIATLSCQHCRKEKGSLKLKQNFIFI